MTYLLIIRADIGGAEKYWKKTVELLNLAIDMI